MVALLVDLDQPLVLLRCLDLPQLALGALTLPLPEQVELWPVKRVRFIVAEVSFLARSVVALAELDPLGVLRVLRALRDLRYLSYSLKPHCLVDSAVEVSSVVLEDMRRLVLTLAVSDVPGLVGVDIRLVKLLVLVAVVGNLLLVHLEVTALNVLVEHFLAVGPLTLLEVPRSPTALDICHLFDLESEIVLRIEGIKVGQLVECWQLFLVLS